MGLQTIRFLPVPSGSVVPNDIFFLLVLHSLWRCNMIERNADVPRTTKSTFTGLVGQIKSVYDHVGEGWD